MYFSGFNLEPFIKKTLSTLSISKATEIQEKTLPYLIKGKSLIITSCTGSGKTYCYLLPILNGIDFSIKKIQAIILLPTKELARQVYTKIIDFKKNEERLKATLLIGNMDINKQIQNVKSNPPQIIVGTVTRTLDLINKKIINRDISFFVIDEADMLLDLGFGKQVSQIFASINSFKLQKIACSATIHTSLANQFKNYLGNTIVVSSSESIWQNDNIKHKLIYARDNSNSLGTLMNFLKKINPYFCIIFANTIKEVDTIHNFLSHNGYRIGKLHKELTSRERKNIFRDINKNNYQYLVATDLASRGIDVEGADVVISYGLPDENIWYIHRSGRVGRGGTSGNSYIIYQNGIDNKINRLINRKIKIEYFLLEKNGDLIEKPLRIIHKSKIKLDDKTNNLVKQIIQKNSKKIKPCYKKIIKKEIHKIKQKVRHEFIEQKIRQSFIKKNKAK
ncbi:MAG: DEAD/DEAH box helicase [Mycoplasmataceae bacterium]|nr:DEAD/DEAH box helicase [Mycoplasmataceae bacterium]